MFMLQLFFHRIQNFSHNIRPPVVRLITFNPKPQEHHLRLATRHFFKENMSNKRSSSSIISSIDSVKFKKKSCTSLPSSSIIPTLHIDPSSATVPYEEFKEIYHQYRAIHIPANRSSSSDVIPDEDVTNTKFSWKNIKYLFSSLNEDKKSWCVENKAHDNCSDPDKFFDQGKIGYCSFIVQKDKDALERMIKELPISEIPVSGVEVDHSSCFWIFYGHNNVGTQISDDDKDTSNNKDKCILQGRTEHTDSVSHDGTWHFQLSGTKKWRIRPTEELLRMVKEKNYSNYESLSKYRKSSTPDGSDGEKFIEIECNEGDLLLINTRLWWHCTLLPVQSLDSTQKDVSVPSVSYARDVYFPPSFWGKDLDSNNVEENNIDSREKNEESMTNLDGLYAADDIEPNTVIFTENDMPDAELHRSSDNPNCKVAELEDGTMAIVSRRYIKNGEFFCIEDSSDEEEYDEESEAEGQEEIEDDNNFVCSFID